MGLISSIQPTELEKKLSETPKEKIPVVSSSEPTRPGRDPIPCEICRSPFFWIDTYGVIRCCDCQPAPTRSLVRWPLWGIAGPPGGPWWWETLPYNRNGIQIDPVVFRSGEQTTCDGDGDPDVRLQLVEWELSPGGRRILSVVGRSRVDRGTLWWCEMGRGKKQKER